ncbi:MAG TPA: SHOCT domain-containing protein [Solirubrobacteraceae bacterium]|nr:SHOCT domain-containing protein [Solirubrobacteraceae bacterium]
MEPDEQDDHETDDPRLNTAPTDEQETLPTPEAVSTPDGAATAPSATISRRRLIGVDVLIGVTTVLLVVGIFATWANRLLFSPDNWSKTSTQLLQDANVRSTTANYVVNQLYANVDVEGLIKQNLPTQLQGLAGPAAGALRNAAVSGTELALAQPRFQQLWAQANRAADQTFIDVVNGRKGAVGFNNGVVTLDLASLVDNIATRLGLPSDIASKLPPSVANLTIFKSNQLKYVQNGGKAIKGLALWLTIIVPLLYILALFLAKGHRRRTLMTIGFAGILAGVIVILARSILQGQVANALTSDASLQVTIRHVYNISTQILHDVAGAIIFIAIVLVVAAWFAGPARPAVAMRRAIAPFLREQAVATYVIVLGIMVIVFVWQPIQATTKPLGILVFTVLALFGTWVLIRQTAEEFPDARSGATTQAIRARMASMREGRHTSGNASHTAAPTTVDQLGRLAELRDRGAITPEEYESAKAQLLGG